MRSGTSSKLGGPTIGCRPPGRHRGEGASYANSLPRPAEAFSRSLCWLLSTFGSVARSTFLYPTSPPRLAARAGIEKRVHAHGLRHAFAIGLEREGATVSVIRDLLGHSSAAVTDRYLRRLGASEAVDFARARSWAGL